MNKLVNFYLKSFALQGVVTLKNNAFHYGRPNFFDFVTHYKGD